MFNDCWRLGSELNLARRLGIGKSKGIFRSQPRKTSLRPPRAIRRRPLLARGASRLPEHAAAACHSSAPRGVARLSTVWTCGLGWVTGESHGFPGGEGLATLGLKTLRGEDFKREFKAQGGEIHRRRAHVAYGPTLAWTSSNTHSSWRRRAGAMGGGTEASLRWRKIRVITDSWVKVARPGATASAQRVGALPSAHTVAEEWQQ